MLGVRRRGESTPGVEPLTRPGYPEYPLDLADSVSRNKSIESGPRDAVKAIDSTTDSPVWATKTPTDLTDCQHVRHFFLRGSSDVRILLSLV
jgi:hypothetical protein